MPKYDVAIIGGGILGTCISYWLSCLYDLDVCVIEKEQDVAKHTSSRNTGLVHSPFYLDPQKRRKSAVSSLVSHDLWESLAKERSLPWHDVGTIELAIKEDQYSFLEKYLKWGVQNGIPEDQLEILDCRQLQKKEPNVVAHAGLFCKWDVSADYGTFTREVRRVSEQNNTEFMFDSMLAGIKESKTKDETTLIFADGKIATAKFVINCAGGNSLNIAKQFGFAHSYDDIHFRGEYWVADKPHDELVRRNIYTVARYTEFPFLDPHWIKRSNGTTEIGPNAVPVATPETYEGYAGDMDQVLSKLREIFRGNVKRLLTNIDFLRLVSKEIFSSVSKTAMVYRIQKFIPSVRPEYFSRRGTAGVRTPIITPKGEFLSDILELFDENSFHIVNYNSPGATGSPAYSALVVKTLQDNGIIGTPTAKKTKKSIWDFDSVIDAVNSNY